MNDLELIKKFAELEGVKGTIEGAINEQQLRYNSFMTSGTNAITAPHVQSFESMYNPITDLALNCAARDKYKVEIDYSMSKVFIANRLNAYREVNYDTGINAHLQRAVIECIVKSKDSEL